MKKLSPSLLLSAFALSLTLQSCTPTGGNTNTVIGTTPNTPASATAMPEPSPMPLSSDKPTSVESPKPVVTATPSSQTGSGSEPSAMPSMGPELPPSAIPSSEASSSPSPMPTPTATPRSSSGGGGGFSSRREEYLQIERLARPAINEGLIISNNLLNTWNSVPPSVDLTSAAAPIAAEATAVLSALGNDQDTINALFTALLPDVMRIDTTRVSGYVGSGPGMLDNVTSQLRPIGGRMIKDDVIDITLALAVPDGAPFDTPLAGFESDGVSYDGPNAGGSGHQPVLDEFPYLAAPN